MSLLLKQIFSFIKLLNSDTGTNQIAAGIVCGLVLGFAPSFSLQTVLVLILMFFFRIQIGAAFGSAILFKIIGYFLDPVFDSVGRPILENQGLTALFTTLYNLPLLPFTRFNNSAVMGAGVVAIVLALPVFFASKKLIVAYRETVVTRFRQSAVFKAIRANFIYQWYVKYDQLTQ